MTGVRRGDDRGVGRGLGEVEHHGAGAERGGQAREHRDGGRVRGRGDALGTVAAGARERLIEVGPDQGGGLGERGGDGGERVVLGSISARSSTVALYGSSSRSSVGLLTWRNAD